MNTEKKILLREEESQLAVVRCEAKDWSKQGFYKHHYKQEDINEGSKAFMFYYGDEIVGFCSILSTPRKNNAESVAFHRIAVLPKFQRLGLASFMCNFIAGVFKNNGNKIYMKCSSPLGEYFNKHPELWLATTYNGILRQKNNSEGNKYKERLESISFNHSYIGDSIEKYEELLFPIKEMREKNMLYKPIKIEDMNGIISKLNERLATVKNITPKKVENKTSTTYRTMTDAMEAARNLPRKRQLFKEFWHEEEVCVFFSEQGKGKTICALQIADELSRHEKVCYLDYELSDQQIYSRYSDNGIEYQFNTNLMRPIRDQITFKEEQTNSLLQYLEIQYHKYGIKTFIIDNITALSQQLGSASAMINLMNKLVDLKSKYRMSILILAHTKKRNKKNPIEDNDLAGSKRILALCDSAFTIGSTINDESALYLKQIKVRECEMKYGANNVITCHIEKVNSFIKVIEDGYARERDLLSEDKSKSKEAITDMILVMHENGMANRSIAKELGISEGTVRNRLKTVAA